MWKLVFVTTSSCNLSKTARAGRWLGMTAVVHETDPTPAFSGAATSLMVRNLGVLCAVIPHCAKSGFPCFDLFLVDPILNVLLRIMITARYFQPL
jgi:hypothetical protein